MPQDPTDNRYAESASITDASVAAAAPTKAEFDALVAKFNAVLAALRKSSLISEG